MVSLSNLFSSHSRWQASSEKFIVVSVTFFNLVHYAEIQTPTGIHAFAVTLSRRQTVFHLQPDQERSFANGAPIASVTRVTLCSQMSHPLHFLQRRAGMLCVHLLFKRFAARACLRLDAAEPIPADIIGPAWQMASDFAETAVELNVQLSKSCVLFGAPSFTLDRRI